VEAADGFYAAENPSQRVYIEIANDDVTAPSTPICGAGAAAGASIAPKGSANRALLINKDAD